MIFTHSFESGLADINNEKKVKNKSLLTYLENIAGLHADSVKNGLYDIIETGFTWVILEWKMQVIDRPAYGEKLDVHTWARNSGKFYCYRDFEVYCGGALKVIASSKWMAVDIKNLRPMRITDELISKYMPEPDKNVFGIEEFEKMKEQPAYDTQAACPVRRTDIDINGHVHNLVYLDMAYELLDGAEPDFVEISYKKELHYGDDARVLCRRDGESAFVAIKTEAGTSAVLNVKYSKQI